MLQAHARIHAHEHAYIHTITLNIQIVVARGSIFLVRLDEGEFERSQSTNRSCVLVVDYELHRACSVGLESMVKLSELEPWCDT
jgi:hypothetical protein